MALTLVRVRTRPRYSPDASRIPIPLVVAVGGVVVLLAVVSGEGKVALVAAVGAPFAAVLVRRPQLGILTMAALAPFDGLLDLLPHAGTLHAWKEAVVAATLLATFVAPADVRRRSQSHFPGWYPAVAGLVGLGAVSAAVVGGNQGITGLRIDFFYLLLACAIWRCPLGERDRDRLVTILMVDGAITGAVGLLEEAVGRVRLHALGFPYDTTIRFAGGHILRAFGTFSYQAPFAYFLMAVLLVGVSQALTEPSRTRNRLFVASLPVVLGSLLFTFERGAWLGLAFGCLYLAWRRHRGILLAVPPALLVLLYLPSGITTAALSSGSLGQRSSGWVANIHQILLHPLGAGIGTTGAAAAKAAALHARSATQVVAAIYQPDNYYFKTIYELGLVGLWLLVLFLVAATVSCDRAGSLLHGRDSALAYGVGAFLLAAMVASTVATFFEIYPMDLLTWLLLVTVATCATE